MEVLHFYMRDPSNVMTQLHETSSHCMHYAMPLLAAFEVAAVHFFVAPNHRVAACRIAYKSFDFAAESAS
jgi:hypothetical protein